MPMAARVTAHGPRRRTAIAATLALTAIVSAPLLETTLAGQSAAAPASSGEPIDYDAIYRIKDEAVNRSQVMETLSFLTDVHGPRLTNSPNMRAAAAWAKQRLEGYGLEKVALEPWGPFGRGWVNERTVATMTAPQPFPLLAFPKAWTPGTDGAVKGDAVLAVIDKAEDLEKWKGKLKGKIVLVSATRAVPAFFETPTRRYDDKGLTDLSKPSLDPSRRGRFGPGGPGGPGFPGQVSTDFRKQRMAFFIKEGVLALVEMSPGDRGDNGAVRVQAPPEGENQRQTTDAPVLPQIVVAGEHYGRLLRLLDKKIPVALEIDVKNRFVDTDLNSLNVIAELPGSDKADEIVMIGAHFDSWHSGTGATDNGVSSAVMIEAMRILKASGLKPRRTIRMGLWTGEEQGLLGSRAYVTQHFADRTDMVLKPEHAQARRLLQHGQRRRRLPRRLPAGQRGGRADPPGVDAAVRQPRDDRADDPSDRRHRSPVVRRGRPARLPVRPGSTGVRLAHAPHEPGRLRARDPRGSRAERDHHRDVRVSRRDARPAAAAQAAAEAAAGDDTRPASGDDASADGVGRLAVVRSARFDRHPAWPPGRVSRHPLSGRSRRRWPRVRRAPRGRAAAPRRV